MVPKTTPGADVAINPETSGDVPIPHGRLTAFAITGGKKYIIFFAAECTVSSTDTSTWIDLTIEVKSPGGDWVAVSPTDSDNAFCTSHGTDTIAGSWVSAATHAVFKPTADGVQKIRVATRLLSFSEGESYRLDDISLIVEQ